MALTDPQPITINAVLTNLSRTSSGNNSSVYRSNDGLIQETVSHTYGRSNRHLVRVDFSKIAANPFDSSLNAKYSMAAYMVFDVPPVGFTVAEAKQVIDGLIAQVNASSGALITKVLGGEN